MTRLNYPITLLVLHTFCAAIILCASKPVRAQTPVGTDPETAQTVVVTLFTSSHCPYCENVKELVADLKTELPIRTKIFDINNPSDYDLYCKVEATHKKIKFAVPLVIVGDHILIGQSEIFANLEKTVRKYQYSSHNPLEEETEPPSSSSKTHHTHAHHKVRISSKDELAASPHHKEKHARFNKISIISDDQN
ncbi:MAG: hypothetical protein ACP5U1_00170 [Desulfomonilaceae bacterium]